jgi:head-tail adaptor
MSYSKMTSFIDLVFTAVTTDAQGFATPVDTIVASVRAYREDRHGSERWANLATFSEATALFRFRSIPGVTITTAHSILCDGERYRITSVEDVRVRGMYIEALAKLVKPSQP